MENVLAMELRRLAELAGMVERKLVTKHPSETMPGVMLSHLTGEQQHLIDLLNDAVGDAIDTVAAYDRQCKDRQENEVEAF